MTETTRVCSGLYRLLFFTTILLVSACGPSPEERVAHARDHISAGNYRAAVLELKNASRASPDYALARVMLGDVSYRLGDLGTAASEFERALGLGEDRTEVWVALGRVLLVMGRATEAFERVLPALDENSQEIDAHVLTGDVLAVLGNAKDASAAYRRALDIDVNAPGALVGLAMLASAAGQHEQAERILEQATEHNDVSPLAWRATGDFVASRGDFDTAADAYARSISAETPGTPLLDRFRTRVSRAMALIDARRIEAAEQVLLELEEDFPPYPILQFIAGRIAFARNDFAEAQIELQGYLSQVPEDPRGQAILGAVHFSQNNLRQAEAYLARAVRANGGGETARRLLAETFLRLDKPEDALTELHASAATGQNDAVLLTMLGRAEFGLGSSESAIRYFEKSAAVEQDDPAFSLALAAAYLRGDRPEDAVRVLESIPDTPASLYRRETLLIGAYLRQGEIDKAIAQSDELLIAHGDDPTVFALAGVLHDTIGNGERASQLFHHALDLDANNASALFSLGMLAYRQQRFDSAVNYLGRLLDLKPVYTPGLLSLTAVLRQLGRIEEIRPRLHTAIEEAPNSLDPWMLLVQLEIVEGQLDKGLTHLAKARERFPDEPRIDHLEGIILWMESRFEESLYRLNRAVMAAPGNEVFVFDLATAKLGLSDYAGAAQSAREYLELRPSDPRGMRLLVETEIRAGSPNRVKSEVSRFVTENPDLATAHLLYGDVVLAGGDPRSALKSYETAADLEWGRDVALRLSRAGFAAGIDDARGPLARWLSESPEDSEARLVYAQLLEAGGEVDLAVKEYERLEEAGKLDAVGLNNLAWHYSERSIEGAVELAQRAHELAPENGSITDTFGWILFKQGDTENALRLLRRAAEQAPRNRDIRFHLATVLADVGQTDEARGILDELLETDASFPSRERAEALFEAL